MRIRLATCVALVLLAAGCNPNWEPGGAGPEMPPDAKPAKTPPNPRVASLSAVIDELEKKIAANPNDVESMRQMGQALLEIGEYDAAAQVLLEARTIAPKDVTLRVLRAKVLMRRSDQGAALMELEEAKKLAPDDEDVLRGWAAYHLMAEEMDKAVDVRKRLLAKHPDVDDAETIESEIYYLSRFPKLREANTLKTFFGAADAAKRQAAGKRWDEAVVSIQKVLELMPDDPDHWTDLGVAQRESGKKQEGIASFRKALGFAKNNSGARIELARALSEDGDAKGAVAVLSEWSKIDAKRAKKHGAEQLIARLEKGEGFPSSGGSGSSGKTTALPAKDAIMGTVRIAPAIAAKVPKSAALFVIAKKSPADGPPLAVKRMAGATFPAEFTITSVEVMMGGPFEGQVHLSARIEIDGKMGSGPGDLEGFLGKAVSVGTGGVELLIDTEVGAAKSPGVAASAAPASTPTAMAGGAGNRITGTIQLAPSVAGKVPSSATLYIIAKANPGPGAPLAVVKTPLPKFPYDFELSDANVMMQGLSFEGSLYLTARIDQDGFAGATPGDIEGVTKSPVPVGTAGVALTIDTVRP